MNDLENLESDGKMIPVGKQIPTDADVVPTPLRPRLWH